MAGFEVVHAPQLPQEAHLPSTVKDMYDLTPIAFECFNSGCFLERFFHHNQHWTNTGIPIHGYTNNEHT